LIVKIFIQFIGNREILSLFIFLNFPTYDNACNGQAYSPVWVRVKGTASGTSNGTLKCYPGDSGGPVFASQTAFGLLKGTSTSGTGAGQCNEYYYMSTDELYNLGFSLVY